YGAAAGLDTTSTPAQAWHEGAGSAGDAAADGDNYGSALASGDFNNDTFDDLAVGVPHKNHSGMAGVGAILVLYGTTPSGLSTTNRQDFDQDAPGIPGAKQVGDPWGSALG